MTRKRIFFILTFKTVFTYKFKQVVYCPNIKLSLNQLFNENTPQRHLEAEYLIDTNIYQSVGIIKFIGHYIYSNTT